MSSRPDPADNLSEEAKASLYGEIAEHFDPPAAALYYYEDELSAHAATQSEELEGWGDALPGTVRWAELGRYLSVRADLLAEEVERLKSRRLRTREAYEILSQQAHRALAERISLENEESRRPLTSDERIRLTDLQRGYWGSSGGFRWKLDRAAAESGEAARRLESVEDRLRAVLNLLHRHVHFGDVKTVSEIWEGAPPPSPLHHERAMVIGKALYLHRKRHESGDESSPWPENGFPSGNKQFTEWAGEVIGRSGTTAERALKEAGCYGKASTKGAVGDGLERRLEATAAYFEHHASST